MNRFRLPRSSGYLIIDVWCARVCARTITLSVAGREEPASARRAVCAKGGASKILERAGRARSRKPTAGSKPSTSRGVIDARQSSAVPRPVGGAT